MAIRIPTQGVLNAVGGNEVGAGSVAGGIAYQFMIPQDTDNVVVKLTASIVGGLSATFQTSDDGGTTWYDVQRSSIVSNANSTNAEWMSIPTINPGVHNYTSVVAVGSVVTVNDTVGVSAASTLGAGEVSGLPILGTVNRIFIRLTGNITSATSNSYTAAVKVNQQSAGNY